MKRKVNRPKIRVPVALSDRWGRWRSCISEDVVKTMNNAEAARLAILTAQREVEKMKAKLVELEREEAEARSLYESLFGEWKA